MITIVLAHLPEKPMVFLKSQTGLIKLVSPQDEQLGIHVFKGKTVMLHLLERPFKGHITEDRSRKKPSTWSFSTLYLCFTRCALYRCATTTA